MEYIQPKFKGDKPYKLLRDEKGRLYIQTQKEEGETLSPKKVVEEEETVLDKVKDLVDDGKLNKSYKKKKKQ